MSAQVELLTLPHPGCLAEPCMAPEPSASSSRVPRASRGRRSSWGAAASSCWGWFRPGQTLGGADELEMAPAWSPAGF